MSLSQKTSNFIQVEGALFEHVQSTRLFDDSKTFVDAIPKGDPQAILSAYEGEKNQADFDLAVFVAAHFDLPDTKSQEPKLSDNIDEHVDQMWTRLSHTFKAQAGSTLIPLPDPHIVPGGRFRECYYWDTYFTSLGLVQRGKIKEMEQMIANFAFLINHFGFIPNGNRTYYLSRSQPPFFAHLLSLLQSHAGNAAALQYLPQLTKEYEYWMEGKEQITAVKPRQAHCVLLEDDLVLNRYWDAENKPRPEAFAADSNVYAQADEHHQNEIYRHIRAACESGWDFSSRWLKDHTNLATIHTCDFVPVDLNCLLYFMEELIADFSKLVGDIDGHLKFDRLAEQRKKAIQRYFWNHELGYFFDYQFPDKDQSDCWTLAGVFPLFVRVATQEQSDKIAEHLSHRFLNPGGLATSLQRAGQQWDLPNGWAPLQWVAIQGLLNYNHHELAKDIAAHWYALNRDVFKQTHKMLEKYNVVDASEEALAGEYAMQEGFGWTNAIYLCCKNLLDIPIDARA